MPNPRRKKAVFGISLEPSWRLGTCLELGALAEKLNFSTLWVPDSGPATPYSDCTVSLTALATKTKRIRLGSAIVNSYTRNPAAIASSFLALADLSSNHKSKQRMILGLGMGADYNLAKFGISRKKNGMLANLREAVEAIRELFEGKTVTVRAEGFAIEGISLSKPKEKIPIHLGVVGPRALRLAGEISDGIILTDRIATDLEESIKHIELGIGDGSRRRDELELTNSVVISQDENRRRAKKAASNTCAYLVAWMTEEKAATLGFDLAVKKRIAGYIQKGEELSAGALVESRMLDTLTVSGNIEDCIRGCDEHLRYDIDQVAFCEPFGPDPMTSLRLLARKVLPRLSR